MVSRVELDVRAKHNSIPDVYAGIVEKDTVVVDKDLAAEIDIASETAVEGGFNKNLDSDSPEELGNNALPKFLFFLPTGVQELHEITGARSLAGQLGGSVAVKFTAQHFFFFSRHGDFTSSLHSSLTIIVSDLIKRSVHQNARLPFS